MLDPDPVLWTARAAMAGYLLRFPFEAMRQPIAARIAWTAGSVLLATHVGLAFGLEHGWSHTLAVRETARQTEEVFGWDWGGGVWVNYFCLIVWNTDAARMWITPGFQQQRGVWFWAVNGFLAVIVISGTVVFASRWWGVFLAASLLLTLIPMSVRWPRQSSRVPS